MVTDLTAFNNEAENTIVPSPRKPSWLKRSMAFGGKQGQVRRLLAAFGLRTVCSEAKCPNRSECYAQGTATFLVMGPVCTRNCSFCSVMKGSPMPLSKDEINRVVEAVRAMKLHHVVITSVTRDDLCDGGASFFAEMVAAFRRNAAGVTIELLIPDLKGDPDALATVLRSRPDILNHNVETVPSLYRTIRPQADYHRSLLVLQRASRFGLATKSGLMVGLGESPEEVFSVLDDLKTCGCRVVTIGQYLQPSPHQTPVKAFISPQQFKVFAAYGEKTGIPKVVAGPFVRSSYHASKIMEELLA
ncbi:MAG: lipoyl synthase [Chitinispirillaceae bacterium]|nr:lipoyl synthase [Chitinispirillaceae bacterium]